MFDSMLDVIPIYFCQKPKISKIYTQYRDFLFIKLSCHL